ncbi:hypothetical protein [Streptomyces sp. UNOC14_S4]|uniref:hypothetical protein n=1 Tax=Streptomyces sp. UNOC14_S4 TaxID=2872340 RepID=UPI001E3C67A1|nr:hypothetical protein [Streptomyces sp. UNOC14_S4]MCC3769832.1 hypothetical protein [Streptomyces sp. UNOC14_S4]
MNAPRTTGFVLAGAACGTLALALMGSFATPAPAAPPHAAKPAVAAPAQPAKVPAINPLTPTPEALRRAAVEGMSAIDTSEITKMAAGTAKACDMGQVPVVRQAPGRQAVVQAPAQANTRPSAQACASVKQHLGALNAARAALLQQSTAAKPDANSVSAATTDAVAATVVLAKDDEAVPENRADGEVNRNAEANRGIDGYNRGGLLGTVTGILRGAVGAFGGLAGGALIGLGGLLHRLTGALVAII